MPCKWIGNAAQMQAGASYAEDATFLRSLLRFEKSPVNALRQIEQALANGVAALVRSIADRAVLHTSWSKRSKRIFCSRHCLGIRILCRGLLKRTCLRP